MISHLQDFYRLTIALFLKIDLKKVKILNINRVGCLYSVYRNLQISICFSYSNLFLTLRFYRTANHFDSIINFKLTKKLNFILLK